DGSPVGKLSLANTQGHYDLFERGVARAFPDSIDRALYLPRSRLDCGQRVCHREPQIVVAMNRDGNLLDSVDASADGSDQLGVLLGNGVAHRVWNIDDVGPGIDGRLHKTAKVIDVGARSILRRELNVVAKRLGIADRIEDLVQRLIASDSQ